MIYGITEQGFIRKPYSVILSELKEKAQSADLFGPDLDVSPTSHDGMWLMLMSWKSDRQWQLAEDVYYSLWLSSATGASLDRAVKFGFVSRRDETYAVVLLVFTGSEDTAIEKGTLAETSSGIVFETLQDVVITNGVAQVYAQCQTAGPSGIVAKNSVTSIKTPLKDVESVNNPASSYNGYSRETDLELREKYANLPSSTGSSCDAIRTAIAQLSGVSFARVFDNTSEATSDAGIPPHAIEAVVSGGDEEIIASTILSKKAAGVETYGSIEKYVTDTNGLAKAIRFSRPEIATVFVIYTIVRDDDWVDANTPLIKRNAIKYIGGIDDLGAEYPGVGVGQSAYTWKLTAAQSSISGIIRVGVKIGRTLAEAEASTVDILTFASRDLPHTDLSNIVVRFE